MKRYINLILGLLIILIGSSCEEEEPETPPISELIKGEWRMVKSTEDTYNLSNQFLSSKEFPSEFEYNFKDKSFTVRVPPDNPVEIDYVLKEVNGDTFFIYYIFTTEIKYKVVMTSENQMTWSERLPRRDVNGFEDGYGIYTMFLIRK